MRRFSREIFLVTATSISVLLSLILPASTTSYFNVLFPSSARRSVRNFSSFISPFYLYFMVPPYVRHSVSIVANILQNIHVSLLLWFLFMHHREHSQSQYVKFPYVYVDYLSKNLLAFADPARAAPACYFLVNPPSLIPSFLPFVASIFATPSNTNRRDVISPLTEREKGVSRELKLFRE